MIWESLSENLIGQFLIATPSLNDPHFSKTVTLICEHNESGSLGLIVGCSVGKSLGAHWNWRDSTNKKTYIVVNKSIIVLCVRNKSAFEHPLHPVSCCRVCGLSCWIDVEK